MFPAPFGLEGPDLLPSPEEWPDPEFPQKAAPIKKYPPQTEILESQEDTPKIPPKMPKMRIFFVVLGVFWG